MKKIFLLAFVMLFSAFYISNAQAVDAGATFSITTEWTSPEIIPNPGAVGVNMLGGTLVMNNWKSAFTFDESGLIPGNINGVLDDFTNIYPFSYTGAYGVTVNLYWPEFNDVDVKATIVGPSSLALDDEGYGETMAYISYMKFKKLLPMNSTKQITITCQIWY